MKFSRKMCFTIILHKTPELCPLSRKCSSGKSTGVKRKRKEIEEEILRGYHIWLNFKGLSHRGYHICLSHMAINLAQLVIHKQFPSINRLEHTELGLKILFGNYHWITVSGSNEAEINVYDLLNKGSVHWIFLHQISDTVKLRLII